MNNVQYKRFFPVKPYMVVVLLLLFYFAVGVQSSIWRGLYFAVLFTSIQLFVYYGNQNFLIPKFFEHDKRKYYVWNAIFILIFVLFIVLINFFIYPLVTNPPKASSFIFPFFLHTILSVSAWWISISKYLIDKEKITNKEIDNLKSQKLESELKYLKSQINPHFFFNAMNNIYSMAYIGEDSVPEKIAMLSDMMRYVLYECESDFIPLKREIEYINSYIEFQQLKTEGKQNIKFLYDHYNGEYLIAPMLLIPFVENGFKHSKIEKDKSAFVNINLIQTQELFSFTVTNSYPEVNFYTQKSQKNNGIGIDNVRNRLELLYRNNFILDISQKDGKYKAHLELYRK